jgi:uncharacterized membrane protein/predicted DsbA family dithiol-disulfide isomerase
MTRKAPAASPAAPPPRLALAVLLLLAAAGLVVSLLLVKLHADAHAGLVSFCAISETVNCDKVAMSEWSVFLKLPVAAWGALGYAAALALSAWGLTSRRLHPRWPAGLLFLFGLAAVAASLTLAYISKVLIGAWCILCMGSWAISLATLVTAVWACRGAGPMAAVRADLAALLAAPRRSAAALVIGLAGVMALALLYPRPPPRPPTPPPAGTGLGGTSGVRSPLVPLRDPAEGALVFSDYECPYCFIAHGKLRELLARRPDIKVVKRHFPLDQACNPLIKRPMHRNACLYARAAICAEAQGHFEAMDDALFQNTKSLPPREPTELARALGLDAARFDACLASPETSRRLQEDIAAGARADIKATPTYLVGDASYAGELPESAFLPMKTAAGKP